MTLKILSKNVKKLREKLRRIYNKYIVLRYASSTGHVKCVTCGAIKPHTEMECGHYYHNKNLPLAFEERNTHPQCKKCNKFMGGNRDQYALFLEYKYGMGILQELIALDKPIPQGHFWLEEKIEEYKEKLKQVKEERGIE